MMLDARLADAPATLSTSSSPETPTQPLKTPAADPFAPLDTFARRHIGPQPEEIAAMLELVGYASLDDLADAVIPPAIRMQRALDLPPARGEREALESLRAIMAQNKVFPLLHRPGILRYHYAARHPAQHPGEPRLVHRLHALPGGDRAGARLEALLNFQTMVADLTRPRHRQRLAARRSDRRPPRP